MSIKKGGKSPRQKGNRAEREIIKILGGERVPLSGSAGGSFSGDIIVPYLGNGECKVRKNGFKQLYAWLEGRDFVALKADRRPWLVVIPAEDVKLLIEDMDKLKKILLASVNGPNLNDN
jgi:Holliday junction resolvase